MDLLKRELAPIVEGAWKLIDDEAAAALKIFLSARPFVDFDGPHGWGFAGVDSGRLRPLADQGPASVSQREFQALVELRVPIELSRAELDAVGRGASQPQLDPVVDAARAAAEIETEAVFRGLEAAGIRGILSTSPHEPVALPDSASYPQALVHAVEQLRRAGVDGPYGLALGVQFHDELHAATEAGYPILERVRRIIDGPIVRVPSLDGAAVLSMRGGDYQLTVGQDFSIGYSHHDADTIGLFLVESFTFRVAEPDACVALRRRD